MDIKYLGHASFFIRTKRAKIVIDPHDSALTGIKYSKQEADIVIVSRPGNANGYTDGVKGDFRVFDWPGEYEKLEARLTAFSAPVKTGTKNDQQEFLMFKLYSEGVSLLHCAGLNTMPSDALLEQIGTVDILCIPIGGGDVSDASLCEKIIKEVDPSIVIPMWYSIPGVSKAPFDTLKPLSEFLNSMGEEDLQPIEKYSFKKEDANSEHVAVVTLAIA